MSPLHYALPIGFLLLVHAMPAYSAPLPESFGTLQRSHSRIPILDLADQGELTIILLPEDKLLRMDLATVLSPYIGETEKNLDRLMDRAVKAGAVILFDEADALFGEGSQLTPLNDEYANQEVSYLLIPISAMNEELSAFAAGKLGLRFWALPDAADLWSAYEIAAPTGAILLLNQDGKAINVGTVAEIVHIAQAVNLGPNRNASTKKADIVD